MLWTYSLPAFAPVEACDNGLAGSVPEVDDDAPRTVSVASAESNTQCEHYTSADSVLSAYTVTHQHAALNMPIRHLQDADADHETLRAQRHLNFINAHHDALISAMDEADQDLDTAVHGFYNSHTIDNTSYMQSNIFRSEQRAARAAETLAGFASGVDELRATGDLGTDANSESSFHSDRSQLARAVERVKDAVSMLVLKADVQEEHRERLLMDWTQATCQIEDLTYNIACLTNLLERKSSDADFFKEAATRAQRENQQLKAQIALPEKGKSADRG